MWVLFLVTREELHREWTMLQKRQLFGCFRNRLYNQRGISLLPLAISIAIFTIIAVQYNLPQIEQQRREVNIANAQITSAQILHAALDYRVDNGLWPVNASDLTPTYLSIINNNAWGHGWTFIQPPGSLGLVLATQTRDNRTAMALAAKYGAIARVCANGIQLCGAPDLNGNWVHIGIAPP